MVVADYGVKGKSLGDSRKHVVPKVFDHYHGISLTSGPRCARNNIAERSRSK